MWTYKGVCDQDRLSILQTNLPFEDIATKLKRCMEIVCCHTTECTDKHGYKRTIYCVEISPQLFDMFFNSQSGYRGTYFQSPERGVISNNLLLRMVGPQLVAWTHANCKDQDPGFAAESLLATSAKVWLAEDTLSLCERCKGEWKASLKADIEIINGRWEINPHIHAQWGRQAHWFKKIRFIGAFLNDAGEEYIAPHKKMRARDIWESGWS